MKLRAARFLIFLWLFEMAAHADVIEDVLKSQILSYSLSRLPTVAAEDSKEPLDATGAQKQNLPDLDVRIVLESDTKRSSPLAIIRVHRHLCAGDMLPPRESAWKQSDGFELIARSLSSALAYLSLLYEQTLAGVLAHDFDRAGVIALCHRYKASNCMTAVENMLSFDAVSKTLVAVAADMVLILTIAAGVSGDAWAKPFRDTLIRHVRGVQILATDRMLPNGFTLESFQKSLMHRTHSVKGLADIAAQIRRDLLNETSAAREHIVEPFIRKELKTKQELRRDIERRTAEEAERKRTDARLDEQREKERYEEAARHRAEAIIVEGVRALGVGLDSKDPPKSVTVSVFRMPSSRDRAPAWLIADAARKLDLMATVDPGVAARDDTVAYYESTDPAGCDECCYCCTPNTPGESRCRAAISKIFSCLVSWSCYPVSALTCGCCGMNRQKYCCVQIFAIGSLGARLDRCCYNCLNGGRTDIRIEAS